MTKAVLIVDDEPYILETTRYILASEGLHVLTARNGEEALAILRREHPRVVLLDVMMAKMSGYEVCKQVKADPTLCRTSVIFLTARSQKVDEDLAFAAGADAFFRKPVDDVRLLATIEAALATA